MPDSQDDRPDSQDDRPDSDLSDDLFAGDGSDDPGSDGAATKPRRADRPRRRPVPLIIGLCLLLLGVGVLGWVGYQYVGTNVLAEQRFEDEKDRLRQQWDNPPADDQGDNSGSDDQDPAGGSDDSATHDARAVALMRIPRFGPDFEVPLLPGITDDVLSSGVGIYDQAVEPGEIGNFSVAGHRITRGEPFRRLLEIQKGDQIIIETRDAIYTYIIDVAPSELTVDASEGWVLDPVPGKKDETPSQALITLTTCQDLFNSPDRSVGFGHLAEVQNK